MVVFQTKVILPRRGESNNAEGEAGANKMQMPEQEVAKHAISRKAIRFREGNAAGTGEKKTDGQKIAEPEKNAERSEGARAPPMMKYSTPKGAPALVPEVPNRAGDAQGWRKYCRTLTSLAHSPDWQEQYCDRLQQRINLVYASVGLEPYALSPGTRNLIRQRLDALEEVNPDMNSGGASAMAHPPLSVVNAVMFSRYGLFGALGVPFAAAYYAISKNDSFSKSVITLRTTNPRPFVEHEFLHVAGGGIYSKPEGFFGMLWNTIKAPVMVVSDLFTYAIGGKKPPELSFDEFAAELLTMNVTPEKTPKGMEQKATYEKDLVAPGMAGIARLKREKGDAAAKGTLDACLDTFFNVADAEKYGRAMDFFAGFSK